MVENKKLFLGLWVLAGLLGSAPVQALENDDALLVKIHDIKPVKNERGVTTNCEFTTTIYNRSSNDVSEVNFELNWYDEATKNTIEQEKSMNVSDRMRRTEDFVSSDVRSQVNIPVLKKNTQKSVQGKINTDRCFLLMEDAVINVKSCKSGATSRKDSISCDSLFQYVSSKSPEYYTDFLAVTLDKQKEEDEKKQEQVSQELDTMFDNIEENLQKTSRLLTTTYATANSLSTSAVNVPPAPNAKTANESADKKDDAPAVKPAEEKKAETPTAK